MSAIIDPTRLAIRRREKTLYAIVDRMAEARQRVTDSALVWDDTAKLVDYLSRDQPAFPPQLFHEHLFQGEGNRTQVTRKKHLWIVK